MIETENPKTSSVGETLRSARTSKKKTLQHYADKLRIRAFYLEQLEADQYHDLPALVYSVGFVRLYANELGLDSLALIEQFKSEYTPPRTPFETAPLDQTTVQKNLPLKQMAACFAVLVLISSAWVIKGYLTAEQPVEVASYQPPSAPQIDTPPLPQDASESISQAPATPATQDIDLQKSTEPKEDITRVAQADGQSQASTELPNASNTEKEKVLPVSRPVELTPKVKNNLILTASTDSWIEVRNREKEVILSRVVQAGKTCALPCQEGYTFATGNAKGVSLELNGKKLNKLSSDEKVIRDVSLDPESLKTRLSSQNH